ncbi:MAG: carboxypeptidase-like regulatory domain-containing protein, partial [Patescibacteria group bacterium]|nr:carboxypeptidase-like regulatory domain-containing protein [Patescibacteria group bacterium]
MLKYFRATLLIIFSLIFFRADFVSAATFYLEPASGDLIRGCLTNITLRLSTDGASSNGAQAYVDYSSLGGGTINIAGAGLFSTYATPPGVPASTLGIYGYGGVTTGNGLSYATIRVRSNTNGPLTLTVHPNTADPASKIAEHPSSNDILTSVASGSYTVIDGYCETQPPYLSDLNPVADKPNHPVGQNILFDIRDADSGVNINTLSVTVKQNNVDVPFNQTATAHGTDSKWYSIVIDPTSDLTPELKVVVTVAVNDKAGNTMTRTYQFNDLTCSQLGCLAGGLTPQCRDSIDNDGDGRIDFPADAGCSEADDNNEFISSDFVCEPPLACSVATTTTGGEQGTGGGVTPQCADGLDNDGDGLIDLADLGCANNSDNNEYVFGELQCPICVATTTAVVTPSTIAEEEGLSIKDARFFLANRSVETVPNSANVVETLRGVPLTVAIDIKSISDQVSDAKLLLGDKSYRMFYDNGLKLYAVDVLDLIEAGASNGAIVIEHGISAQETIPFTVATLSKGKIIGKDDAKPVAGASVTLEQRSSAGKYVSVSTIKTNSDGEYGFVVPNGTYRISVKSDGFRNEQTAGFAVTNHIIDRAFNLITAVNLLDTNVSVADKATYITEVAGEQAGKILDSANDPAVEQTARQTVAPIALGSAVVATLPALSMLNLLSYLRFLFLQPVFLFGRKKRKKWGVVYNALT